MPDSQPPGGLISRGEAAATLGVSERTVDNLIARKRLSAYRVGSRSIRLDRSEVEALPQAASRACGDDPELRAFIRELVDRAPKLTSAQRDRIAVVLRGGA